MSKVNNHIPQLVPAVGYVRRSTDKQEASIPDQTKAVQRYADDKGYRILRWYTDDAISGDDTEKRLEFQRMLADAHERGDFKAILCWDQDRFGRFDSIEAGYWIHPLRQAEIILVPINEGPVDWSEFNGRVMYGLKQEGKHQFLKDLSRNVTRGQREAANNGSWLGSPPYAYRIEGPKKHKLLVLDDPGKVRVVQRIFREFTAERRNMKAIADGLNADGILSPTGKIPRRDSGGRWVEGWQFDTVKTILRNPAYTGDYAAGRHCYGKYHTMGKDGVAKGKRRCRRPEGEWIVKQDHHKAIIDRATFAAAQAILDAGLFPCQACEGTGKQKEKGKQKETDKDCPTCGGTGKKKRSISPYTPETNPYILSCLLRCGRCGCTLKGSSNGTYRYYECSNRHHNGVDACRGCTVREDMILRSIADHLDAAFLELDGKGLSWRAHRKEVKPGDLPKAFAKVRKLVAPPKQHATDRKRMEKEAKTLADKIDKARRNLVLLNAENIPTAEDEIRRMQDERNELETELRKKPPSEEDINAETMEVLRSLYWLGICFRLTADPQDDWESMLEAEGKACTLTGDFTPMIRRFVRKIAGITVHSRIDGEGRRVRHTFERGEIAFISGLELLPRKGGSRTLVWPL